MENVKDTDKEKYLYVIEQTADMGDGAQGWEG